MNLRFFLVILILYAALVNFSGCKFGKKNQESRDVKADLQLVDRDATADKNTPAPEDLTEPRPGFLQEPTKS